MFSNFQWSWSWARDDDDDDDNDVSDVDDDDDYFMQRIKWCYVSILSYFRGGPDLIF